VSNRNILGIAALACVACCAGPILGVLGAGAALGVASTLFIGLVGVAFALATAVAIVIIRKRHRTCGMTTTRTAVSITTRT
jgi:hypothetical protein